MTETLRLAHDLAGGPTLALGFIRRLYWESPENSNEQQLDLECRTQRMAGASQDFREGVTAFLKAAGQIRWRVTATRGHASGRNRIPALCRPWRCVTTLLHFHERSVTRGQRCGSAG